MTDAGPRKGLWELMGQKRSTDDPAPSPPVSDEASAPEAPSAEQTLPPPVSPAGPLNLSETLPDVKPRGRSLWQMMGQPADTAPALTSAIPESPASLAPHSMR